MFRLQAFLPGTSDALNREKQGCSGWETGTKSFLSQLIGQKYPEMEHIAITGFLKLEHLTVSMSRFKELLPFSAISKHILHFVPAKTISGSAFSSGYDRKRILMILKLISMNISTWQVRNK